jgi:hypothetical protein
VKARPGELLAGGAGALLLIALFFDWYDVRDVETVTAWQAYAVTDLVLAATAFGGMVVLGLHSTSRAPAVPVAANVIVAALSPIALLLVIYRLLNQPGPNDAVGLEPGAYVGLLLTAALTVGTWRALRDEDPRASDRAIPIDERPVPPVTAG